MEPALYRAEELQLWGKASGVGCKRGLLAGHQSCSPADVGKGEESEEPHSKGPFMCVTLLSGAGAGRNGAQNVLFC